MKNLPDKIYLQLGPYADLENDDFLEDYAEVTWSSDRIDETDPVYIRADLVERIIFVVAERWGKDHPGSTVGILGREAIEIQKLLES